MISKRSLLRFKKTASSLVVTLLVIVVLSTIVVAFMQSMSIERKTAQSTKNAFRAKLAAEAGMEAAIRQIRIAAGTNQAYLVGQTNDSANFGPVLVIGQSNLTSASQLMPLISGDLAALSGYPAANSNLVLSYINARTNLSTSNTVNVNLKNELIETTSDTNKYRASWSYLTNVDGVTNARYAYVVLDEWARVNPRYHGDSSLTRDNPTDWFPGMGALPLYTGGTNLLTASEVTAARIISTNLVPTPLTPFTVAQAFSDRATFSTRRHLLTLNDTWSVDVIPAGLAQGGSPKYDLNDLATNAAYGASSGARATNIALIIATNLPSFGSRDRGLQTEDATGGKYLLRLAASLIDYIDSDAVPTLVNSGEPAGMEASPYVVMVAEKNTWVSQSGGPPYTIVIRSDFFAQLWNPYSMTITGNVIFELTRRQTVLMRNGGSDADFNPFTSSSISVTLQPNEFKAVSLGFSSQSFVNNSVSPSAGSTNYPTWQPTTSAGSSITGHPHFRFFWNGALASMNRAEPPNNAPAASGLARNDPGNTFGSIGAVRWSYNCQPANSPNTVADPRISYLSESDWLALGSAASGHSIGRWNGRQTNGAPQRSQDFNFTWTSRDFVRQNSQNEGIALSSASGDPSALASQYVSSDAQAYISVIRNGPMQSLGELGHIFDPIQVNDTGGNSFTTDQGYHRPGGGYSLRIGQPEFTFASTNGRRSIELLDLFTLNKTNASTYNFPAVRGRINVNTATKPVLEALFYNISPRSDSTITNSLISSTNAAVLADVVMTNRPYNKLSDLYKITQFLANSTNYTPALPANAPTNVNNSLPLAGVFDRAREETFGKMVGFTTVQSRAFRVVVIGESLHPVTGKRESRTAVETILSISQNSFGNLVPEIQYLRWEN